MATKAQEQLRTASFRGVTFNVLETSHTVGRRVIVHEYPNRDVPFAEDMGRSAKTFTITGFYSGYDYIKQMKALEEKMQMKGTGELIHPWAGRLMVVPQNASIKYSQALLRVDFDLTFTESGEQKFPDEGVNTSYLAKKSAENLFNTSLSHLYNTLTIGSAQDFVKSTVAKNINKMLGIDSMTVVNQLFGISDALASFMRDGLALLSNSPNSFGEKLAGILGLSRFATSTMAWRNVVREASKFTKDDSVNTESSALFSEGTSDYEEAKATEDYASLLRQVMISNAVGAVANVGTSLDRASESSAVKVMAYDDLIAMRDTLLQTIDEEMFKTDSDEVYQALLDCRASVFKDLTTKAESQARLFEITPTGVFPALVIAYDVYEDAGRDLEIVGRNNIVRPGFVPVAPLKLLSK